MTVLFSTDLTPKLIDALYTEALLLSDEARTYFHDSSSSDRIDLAPQPRVLFSCEAIKVTTRLMYAISWLIAARRHAPPTRHFEWVAPSDDALIEALPPTAISLIVASEKLYDRVARLDAGATCHPVMSPARQLLSQLGAAL